MDWTGLAGQQLERGGRIFLSVTPDRYVVVGTNDEIHAASLDSLREINEDKPFE